ncbi:7-carboxy-7-deazaguanine synthase QueE [Desulfotomaculum varum]
MSGGAYLQEVFSSVQGEGPFVGCRHIFIRLAGCNLKCAYCDTPVEPFPPVWRLEKNPGSRNFITLNNPVEAASLAAVLSEHYQLNLHHAVSLTGGEPLLHTPFLKQLLPLIGDTRAGVLLETNGTLPDQLNTLIDCLDIISMDIKLASSTGQPTPWAVHKNFLTVAAQKQVYVKVVISEHTTEKEIEQTGRLIESISPQIELILQPVSAGGGVVGPSVDKVLRLQERALKILPGVRVIPQTHLMMGQL